jgi:hypothetical protein
MARQVEILSGEKKRFPRESLKRAYRLSAKAVLPLTTESLRALAHIPRANDITRAMNRGRNCVATEV